MKMQPNHENWPSVWQSDVQNDGTFYEFRILSGGEAFLQKLDKSVQKEPPRSDEAALYREKEKAHEKMIKGFMNSEYARQFYTKEGKCRENATKS